MARFAVAGRADTAAGAGAWTRPSAGPHRAAAVLAVWNLFVWGGRLRNLIAEPGPLTELSGPDRWSLAGSLLFGVLAVATLVGLMIIRLRSRIPASLLAAAGIIVWSYRAVVIIGRDYSIGFMIVHTVLAAVSVGLGLWYLRSAYRVGPGVTRPSQSL